jgi:hypothetical protein
MLYPVELGNDPLFPQAEDFQVVFKDDQVGRGVICYRAFKQGELMARMAGEVITDIRQHSLQIDEGKHLYDTYFSGYFLHACDPNIALDMKELTVTAVKDIEANSYLYMDYSSTEDVLFRQFPCNCGSDNCKGWVLGKKEIDVNRLNRKVSTNSGIY